MKQQKILFLLLSFYSTTLFCPDLLKASWNGDYEEAKELIKANADIDKPNYCGPSPLYIACRNGHKRIAELLLEHNANVDANGSENACFNLNTEFWNPLMVAREKGNKDIAELLLKYNANVNMRTFDLRNTSLHYAVGGEDVDEGALCHVIELLLKHNADPKLKNCFGRTPLHHACIIGHRDIAELLLKYNADVHSKDQEGGTSLYHACQCGNKDIVELLFKAGATITEKMKSDLRPEDLGIVESIEKRVKRRCSERLKAQKIKERAKRKRFE